MTIKRFAYQLLLLSLTLGASLIIGLLSFGGLYALWPNLVVASLAFVLSVAYEGEIYLQNLKGALKSLLNPNALKFELSKIILRDYFPHHVLKAERPAFFLEYEDALHHLHAFEHQTLTPAKKAKKQNIERKLKELEKQFLKCLMLPENALLSKEEHELVLFLKNYPLSKPSNGQAFLSLPEYFQQQLKRRLPFEPVIRAFSLLTACLMGIGTTYLLLEAFAMLPLLATFTFAPALLIVPMAMISGVAYGLLTYNTLKNILIHDRIRTRIQKLQDDYKKHGLTWHNAMMLSTGMVLGSLAVMLTICTAGTWWTIIQNTPPLFRSMKGIATVILGTLIPLVTSFAALAFNLENSTESLEMIDEALEDRKNWKRDWEDFKYKLQKQWDREHPIQRFNPFRLILLTTLAPLRFILFLGHLISIGVTSDRVPGLSQLFSAFLGVVSELFEDGHYFIKHKRHEHNTAALVKERLDGADHHHEDDLPSRLLNLAFAPIRFLSVLWDYIGSQFNSNPTYRQNWRDFFKVNEIEPEIPLLDLPKKRTRKEAFPQDSASKIAQYFEKNKHLSTEDSISSNCPFCPQPYTYVLPKPKNNINQKKTELTEPSSNGAEKKASKKKTSRQQRAGIFAPKINFEFCTPTSTPESSELNSGLQANVLNP